MNVRSIFPLIAYAFAVIVAGGVEGCKDAGTEPVMQSRAPVITGVQPDSAAIGDTLMVAGSNFGDVQGSSTVHVGGVQVVVIVSWGPSQIRFAVPAGATGGTVVVTVSGSASNSAGFTLRSALPAVSFSQRILPIFTQYGCYDCHGGNGGLIVRTVAQLLQGGNHGAAITPGDADGSLLIKKLLSPAPFGSRMPFGSPALPDTTVQVIRTWINQGAPNN
jgi:hypothetical protein